MCLATSPYPCTMAVPGLGSLRRDGRARARNMGIGEIALLSLEIALLTNRFIPTRDGGDLHAAFQMMTESSPGPVDGYAVKHKAKRKSAYGQGTDADARRGKLVTGLRRFCSLRNSQRRSIRPSLSF